MTMRFGKMFAAAVFACSTMTAAVSVRSGNYIRLKNISLGYNLPDSFCRNNLGGLRVKLFVNGQNLFTKSACDLVDPEVSFTSYPLQRCISTGINIRF